MFEIECDRCRCTLKMLISLKFSDKFKEIIWEIENENNKEIFAKSIWFATNKNISYSNTN